MGCFIQNQVVIYKDLRDFLSFCTIIYSDGVSRRATSMPVNKGYIIFGVFGNSCSCWGPSSESGDSEKPVGRFPLHSEFRKPKTVLFAGHFLFGLSTTKLQIDLPVDWRIRGLGPPEGQLFYLHPPKKKWCWFFWRKTHPKRVFFGFWSSKLQQSAISSHLATVQQVAQELSESFPQPGVIILSTQTLDYYKGNPSKLP